MKNYSDSILNVLKKYESKMTRDDYENFKHEIEIITNNMDKVMTMVNIVPSKKCIELIEDELYPVYIDSEDGGGCNLYDSNEVYDVLDKHKLLTNRPSYQNLANTDLCQIIL